MLKYLFSLIIISIMLASCGESPKNETEIDGEKDIPSIVLAKFNEKAGEFVDKEIKVSGIVDHICKHGGKRIFLVADGADLHVDGEERFDEEIVGSEILVTGIVREFRVDEAYCLQLEEDNINNHSEGKTSQESYDATMDNIKFYRDSMAASGIDHISYYSLDYVSHEELK